MRFIISLPAKICRGLPETGQAQYRFFKRHQAIASNDGHPANHYSFYISNLFLSTKKTRGASIYLYSAFRKYRTVLIELRINVTIAIRIHRDLDEFYGRGMSEFSLQLACSQREFRLLVYCSFVILQSL